MDICIRVHAFNYLKSLATFRILLNKVNRVRVATKSKEKQNFENKNSFKVTLTKFFQADSDMGYSI